MVVRAPAFDSKKKLSIQGKYFEFTSLPDQYISWAVSGFFAGRSAVKKHNIDVIFSTYPIASAHLLGYLIQKSTGKPWIADFRDPMWDEFIPLSAHKLSMRKKIESAGLHDSAKVLVTTNSMKKLYVHRYPDVAADKISVVYNGYDEDDFNHLKQATTASGGPVRFIHAGLLDPGDRDPQPFFEAIKMCIDNGSISESDLIVDLYATGYDDLYLNKIAELGLQNIVRLHNQIPYHRILEEMMESHVLLLFQGPSCNDVIPAKFFEYLRIGKPIFALTTREGETGMLVEKTESGQVVKPLDKLDITHYLSEWISQLKAGDRIRSEQSNQFKKFSREELTRRFSLIIKDLVN